MHPDLELQQWTLPQDNDERLVHHTPTRLRRKDLGPSFCSGVHHEQC